MEQLEQTSSVFVRAVKKWWSSDPFTNGAALAYYAIFAIAPLMIIFVTMLGWLFGAEAVEGQVLVGVRNLAGPEISRLIQALIIYSHESVSSVIAVIIGAIIAIVAALALFGQVHRSIFDMWHAGLPQKKIVVPSFIHTRIVAVIMVLLLGGLIVVSFAVNGIGSLISSHFSAKHSLLQGLDQPISALYVILLFALIYKYLPGKLVTSRSALIGGVTGGILFLVGRFFLGLYIATSAVLSVYGAAGAMILILFWFYYVAEILFFGAALAYSIDQS